MKATRRGKREELAGEEVTNLLPISYRPIANYNQFYLQHLHFQSTVYSTYYIRASFDTEDNTLIVQFSISFGETLVVRDTPIPMRARLYVQLYKVRVWKIEIEHFFLLYVLTQTSELIN